VANAIMTCNMGACVKAQCQQNYFDNINLPGDDCAYNCVIQGEESCNGDDDDCDGLVDAADPDWTPPDSAQFCNQIGACAGNTAVCNPTADQWECSITPAAEDVCDGAGIDEDCDGPVDEDVGLKAGISAPPGSTLGSTCRGPGMGVCRLTGSLACDPADATDHTYTCVNGVGGELAVGASGAEGLLACQGNGDCDPGDTCSSGTCVATRAYCNNTDDDCDGAIDERCDCDPDDGGCSDTHVGCLWDAWAPLPSGGHIFAYEASRPDASSTSQGGTTTQNSGPAPACSQDNRMPWTNVS
jgi:hypothetical protein